MWSDEKEVRLAIVFLRACFVGMAAGCVALPFLLKYFNYEMGYLGSCLLMCISLMFMVWQLLRILGSITRGEPFIMQNVKHMKRISYACYAIAVSSLWMMLVYYTVIKVMLAVIVTACGLTVRVLAKVFKEAVLHKQENDLTI